MTGVPYRDDKAILAWETGNELASPDLWIKQAAATIKGFDQNHLVIDGAQRPLIPEVSLNDPNVDFVQTHHYENDPRQMIDRIRRNSARARGKKPYHVGEFGFLPTDAIKAVIDLVIDRGMSGAMLWSIRYHNRDGGFYWHHEPAGGDLFKAYHWPGFASGEVYDERRLLQLLRQRAHGIRGLLMVPGDNPPPLPRPAPPRLLQVTDGGLLTWRGSTGAEDYQIERSYLKREGPWEIVATGVSDAAIQYHPLYADETACPLYSYAYRVLARNSTGLSDPSNVIGPVKIDHHTLVDELANDSRIFLRQGKLTFRQNEARKFREDCHRLSGEPGSAIVYHAASGIRRVRVFAFSQSDKPGLGFGTSFDARIFQPASPRLEVPRANLGQGSLRLLEAADLHAAGRPARRTRSFGSSFGATRKLAGSRWSMAMPNVADLAKQAGRRAAGEHPAVLAGEPRRHADPIGFDPEESEARVGTGLRLR